MDKLVNEEFSLSGMNGVLWVLPPDYVDCAEPAWGIYRPHEEWGYVLTLNPLGYGDYYYKQLPFPNADFMMNRDKEKTLKTIEFFILNRETEMTKVSYEDWKRTKELFPHLPLGNGRANPDT